MPFQILLKYIFKAQWGVCAKQLDVTLADSVRFAWEEEPTDVERNQLHAVSEIATSEWPVLFISSFRYFLLSQVNTGTAMLMTIRLFQSHNFNLPAGITIAINWVI